MNPHPKPPRITGPLQLIEEAFHLLRQTPASTLLAYLTGTLPFIVGLLYFWSDMSRGAFAHQRLAGEALVMVLLFFWMKTWQAVFASNLLSNLCGEPTPNWTFHRWCQTALRQSIVQPIGLFILPLSVMTVLFLGWTYAFFQNLTALDNTTHGSSQQLLRQAARQARLWPAQNHAMLMAIKAFAIIVFLNLLSAFVAVPLLLKTLLGIETAFSRALSNPTTLLPLIFNSTFLACLFSLSYVCLDPLMKAIYTLRCFYGQSLQGGQDLKAELRLLQPSPHPITSHPTTRTRSPSRTLTAPLLLLLLTTTTATLVSLPTPTSAAPQPPTQSPTVQPPELNNAVDEVLSRREYAWRMPRQEIKPGNQESGVVRAFFDGIADSLKNVADTLQGWVRKLTKWMDNLNNPKQQDGSASSGWHSALQGLFPILVVALIGLFAWLLFRIWRRGRTPTNEITAATIPSIPDLEEEHVDAEQLPEDGWLELAQKLLAEGDLRLALRAFYLASLAHLAHRNLITIARYKSNRDYARELERRGHALPDLTHRFAHNVSVFDRVWYGLHEVNPDLIGTFTLNVEKIRGQA